MHERLKTTKAKRLKKQRSSTVEPVLGTLINFMGMRRIWTRGIKNANKFMIGAATVKGNCADLTTLKQFKLLFISFE